MIALIVVMLMVFSRCDELVLEQVPCGAGPILGMVMEFRDHKFHAFTIQVHSHTPFP